MDEDLRRGLITKKVGFDKMYEDGLIRVAKMRQKNDAFQKHMGPDIDEALREEIHQQSQFIEKEIKELKELINQMENKYRDPESRNKTKQLKADAQKQIERNKIILKDIINTNYLRRSKGSLGSKGKENQDKYMVGGAINYQHLDARQNDKGYKKDSMMTDPYEQQQIQIDYEVQRNMLLEKNRMISQVEQSTQRINDIINDMGIEVQEQGQNLDIITDELQKGKKNLLEANAQLEEASTLQKKSRKKYVILVVILLLVIVAVGGIIFMLNS